MDMVHVLPIDVNTIEVVLVEHIILRHSVQLLVVSIVYALVEFTAVVLGSVTDVTDVLHTLMVIT